MTYHADCFVYGGNPSDKGGGFTITDEQGNLILQEERLKPGFTNNEGELLAALYAIMLASHGDTVVQGCYLLSDIARRDGQPEHYRLDQEWKAKSKVGLGRIRRAGEEIGGA